jgi:tetratricopeptide (TPR) repeat protein
MSIRVLLSVELCVTLKTYLKGAPFYNASSIGHPNLARALSDMAHTRLLQARTLQREADRLRSLAADDEEEAERMENARRDSLKSAEACREKALTEIEAAEKIYARFRNRRGLGTCLLRHAMLHLSAGDFDNALKCAAKAYELGRKADYLLMGGARIVQCMIEGEMCESEVPKYCEHGRLAHSYAQQAILYAAKTQHLELQARAHLAMGFALLNPPLRKTDAATQSHQKATVLINAASLKHLAKEQEELWKRIAQASPATGPMSEWLVQRHGKTLDELKRYIFQAVWQYENGSARGVARNLGISRGAAKASLRKYGLPIAESR